MWIRDFSPGLLSPVRGKIVKEMVKELPDRALKCCCHKDKICETSTWLFPDHLACVVLVRHLSWSTVNAKARVVPVIVTVFCLDLWM